mmetsp:Transcript_2190/g.6076  ORF Transcript_2190/g.6076 Transcript_2190/m.6076 type:complete len:293 (-) Transcript_2190:147-1025(-)|eukprot:CAMPEP_0198110802 /NCGR_PEP_ID=MMETSP1442-20131203/2807_1 /TAXON_ID= /ORGANISM="Craspedostauros australis, Strain CCMP3328" /LENGTH=292 /DNA_ID=CAMNT_0043767005 /DNA_START=724 /DNA_END=1602 /DNA_ORIENTATION=+
MRHQTSVDDDLCERGVIVSISTSARGDVGAANGRDCDDAGGGVLLRCDSGAKPLPANTLKGHRAPPPLRLAPLSSASLLDCESSDTADACCSECAMMWASTSNLHSGQLGCRSVSQGTTQSPWKRWLHGSTFTISPSSNVSRQIAQQCADPSMSSSLPLSPFSFAFSLLLLSILALVSIALTVLGSVREPSFADESRVLLLLSRSLSQLLSRSIPTPPTLSAPSMAATTTLVFPSKELLGFPPCCSDGVDGIGVLDALVAVRRVVLVSPLVVSAWNASSFNVATCASVKTPD